MCGRYTLHDKVLVKSQFGVDIIPDYNICPQKKVLTLNNNLVPCHMSWGYRAVWSKYPPNLINARVETIHEKPSFNSSERCIFVANGYFEWKATKYTKVPYYHYLKDKLIFFAGIYNDKKECCIVTRPSKKRNSFVHSRQPCILQENDFDCWLSKQYRIGNESLYDLSFYEVSKKVNSVINNDKSNISKLT